MHSNMCNITNAPLVIMNYKFKVPEERYGTKMSTKLQNGEREIKEISFDSNTKCLEQDYLDIFEGIISDVINTA